MISNPQLKVIEWGGVYVKEALKPGTHCNKGKPDKSMYFGRSHSVAFSPWICFVGVLFPPKVSGSAGGRREEVCLACTLQTVRCRTLILGRDIG